MGAFLATYPAKASPLKDRCMQLNGDDIVDSATCASSAIKSDLSLRKPLSVGNDLCDPIFAAAADDSRCSKLGIAIKSARAFYPEKMIWGGNLANSHNNLCLGQ